MRFQRQLVSCAAVAAIVVLADAVLAGQATTTTTLPAARDIVTRFVRVIGGEAALRGVKSIRARGTFELVGAGVSGTLEVLSSRPAKTVVRVQLSADMNIETGYDGKIGWEIDPQRGPALVSGRRLTEMADDAWFDAPLHKSDHVRSMVTVAKTTWDKRPAYQVKVIFVSGNETIEYFDVETGLMIGTEATRDTPMGLVPSVGYLRDYRKFGPLLQPTVMSQRVLGIDQTLRLTSYDYDVVPANAFDIPPQIKALIK